MYTLSATTLYIYGHNLYISATTFILLIIFIGISLNFICIFGYLPNLRLQKYESAENYNKPFITLFIYIIKCPGISEILTYFTGHRVLFNKSYKEIFL